eukprot:scaffold44_cov411-Prasinococcus_capsulatus_cf.AAC.25
MSRSRATYTSTCAGEETRAGWRFSKRRKRPPSMEEATSKSSAMRWGHPLVRFARPIVPINLLQSEEARNDQAELFLHHMLRPHHLM